MMSSETLHRHARNECPYLQSCIGLRSGDQVQPCVSAVMGKMQADLVARLVVGAGAAPGPVDVRGLDISDEFPVHIQGDQAP